MKSIRFNILLLLVASSIELVAQTTPQAWVRETDVSTGQMYDIVLPSANGGGFTPTLAISEEGNTFELYARGTAWDTKVYLLDTKLVRAYSPSAAFEIVTDDPYIRGTLASGRYVRRTRADYMFRMNLEISGLIPTSTDQAETSVYFAVKGLNYYPETYSRIPPPSPLNLPEKKEYEILPGVVLTGNNTYNWGPYYHWLDTSPKTKGCGEMIFTVVRFPADGVPATIIAEPKLEVWPVPSATIENITQNQVFIDKIPLVLIHYTDLYPDSRTYVQIYSGPERPAGSAGTIVGTTERAMGPFYSPSVPNPTTVPMTQSVGVVDLSNYTPTDGIYTLEVVTHTPFDGRRPERLGKVTFEVDQVISSRGKLSTAEGGTPTTSP